MSRYISFRAPDDDVTWLADVAWRTESGWTRLMKAAITLAKKHPDEYRRILKETR